MRPNPVLKALGLSDQDRALLIHTDDIGMCHASLAAYTDLAENGVISAGSTMVPCPWFTATAQYCVANPEQVDMGVHATLNSEWLTGYRWRPVSNCTRESGLVDDEGFMHTTTAATQAYASVEAVTAEIRSQVVKALQAGIDVTHIDSHMGTAFYPGFLESYVQIALENRVPPFIVRQVPEELVAAGFPRHLAEGLMGQIETLEAQGLPAFDDVRSVPFDRMDTHLDGAKRAFETLKPGLTYLIIHPSKDTPELRAILPDRWQPRVADYETFMRPELRDTLKDLGIHLITWRQLRGLMRAH